MPITMRQIVRYSIMVTLSLLLACEEEGISPDQVTGSWSWIESQGGLLPTRNLSNSDFRQMLIIEGGTFTDMRADTVTESWSYQLQGHRDGIILVHPTSSTGSKLVKSIATDTVTFETYIENGICNDCAVSTYVRVAQ